MFSAIGTFVFLATLAPPEAPSDEAILRALPAVTRGVPFVFAESRDDLVIVKTRVGASQVSPPVFYPIIGPARLVQTRWECAVYYVHTIQSDFPFPIKATKPRVQVIYIDQVELAK